MNTPPELLPLDLLRLAREECRRFDVFAESGSFQMFESQRLVRELLLETIELQEGRRPTTVDCGRGDVPSRSCQDCAFDTGEPLLALGKCPRWGQSRYGVVSRCAAFEPKSKLARLLP